ncbi:MAG: hypothetical protein M1469_04805 [Bacteroidetes bacterium]|nr:hypothetical protein [Bacteroidota bacterium]
MGLRWRSRSERLTAKGEGEKENEFRIADGGFRIGLPDIRRSGSAIEGNGSRMISQRRRKSWAGVSYHGLRGLLPGLSVELETKKNVHLRRAGTMVVTNRLAGLAQDLHDIGEVNEDPQSWRRIRGSLKGSYYF